MRTGLVPEGHFDVSAKFAEEFKVAEVGGKCEEQAQTDGWREAVFFEVRARLRAHIHQTQSPRDFKLFAHLAYTDAEVIRILQLTNGWQAVTRLIPVFD